MYTNHKISRMQHCLAISILKQQRSILTQVAQDRHISFLQHQLSRITFSISKFLKKWFFFLLIVWRIERLSEMIRRQCWVERCDLAQAFEARYLARCRLALSCSMPMCRRSLMRRSIRFSSTTAPCMRLATTWCDCRAWRSVATQRCRCRATCRSRCYAMACCTTTVCCESSIRCCSTAHWIRRVTERHCCDSCQALRRCLSPNSSHSMVRFALLASAMCFALNTHSSTGNLRLSYLVKFHDLLSFH